MAKGEYLIRMNNGPYPGTRVIKNQAWPLPDEYPMEGGKYVKTNESNLPDEVDEIENIMRGAEYKWVSDA